MLMAVLLAEGQTNVEIIGTSEGAAGKHLAVYGYADMLTQSEVLFDSTTVAEDGSFGLHFFVSYPRLVYVEAERYSQSFYVEPGRRYEVFLPQFDWSMDERRNVYLDPVALPIEFMNVDSNELNLRILRFEGVVDSFFSANRGRVDFRFKPDRKVMKELEALLVRNGLWRMDSTKAVGENVFFERYVLYHLLEMRLAMRTDSRKKLYEKYIANEPVAYHDENYMRFFLSLFAHSISGGTKRLSPYQLSAWVNNGALATYLDSVGTDPMLANERVRELAVLEALKESYYDRVYNPAAVRRMIESIGKTTKFPEHKELAQHLTKELHQSERGAEVPSFVLPDVEHHAVHLDSLKGKWIYLSFVRVDDPHSIAEIDAMAHLRDSVYAKSPDVAFVTVACDREFQKMYHFLKNSRRGARCNWTWVHFDGNYRLLESYGVVSFPSFVLINPEGKQHYTYTPPPASGILLHGPWEKQVLPDYSKPFFEK